MSDISALVGLGGSTEATPVVAEAPGRKEVHRVEAGAMVRDRFCNRLHALRRPDRATSDVVLVYDCAVRGVESGEPAFQRVHTGAIFGRLVAGLESAAH